MKLSTAQRAYVGAYEHWYRTEIEPDRWNSPPDLREAARGLRAAHDALGRGTDTSLLRAIAIANVDDERARRSTEATS